MQGLLHGLGVIIYLIQPEPEFPQVFHYAPVCLIDTANY